MSDPVVEEFVEFVAARDWVTFVELSQLAERHGIPTKGTIAVLACPNGVLWADMSQEFVDLFKKIRRDGRLALDGGSPLAYLIDGGLLKLPLAKRMPRDPVKGYATERWLPSFFRLRAKVET